MQALANPWTADTLKWLHPMRTSRYLLSDQFNPWMRALALVAETVAKNRRPVQQGQSMIEREREGIKAIGETLENARKARDSFYEQAFALLYKRPWGS